MLFRGPANSKAGGSTPARNWARSCSISARNKRRFDVSMNRVARNGETILHSPRSSVPKSGGADVTRVPPETLSSAASTDPPVRITRGTSW